MSQTEPQVETVRVTLRDGEQTISFLADRGTAERLVAGCSGRPDSVGDLLVAADTYQHGLTSKVMSELMQFDNQLRVLGESPLHDAIRQARKRKEVLPSAFQVFDELTEGEALTPRVCPLVVFDLVERTIHAPAELELESSGEVHIHDGERTTDKTVTYFLPDGWSIESMPVE